MKHLLIILTMNVVIIVGVHEIGKMTGYLQGKRDALATNPVSEELELACAALWVGEQNRKYWGAQNAQK